MYVIQPIVYLDAVRTTAFAEIVEIQMQLNA